MIAVGGGPAASWPCRRAEGAAAETATPQGTGDDRREAAPSRAASSAIGTTNYIDSLNPFNYIESQAYQAMIMIYPAARAVRATGDDGLVIEGDWADVVGDLGRRQGLDVRPQAGRRSGRTASR